MNNNKQTLTFRKSVLSIVIMSAVTGGLIALQKQQSVSQTFASVNNGISYELLKDSDHDLQQAVIEPAIVSSVAQSEVPQQMEAASNTVLMTDQAGTGVAQKPPVEVVVKEGQQETIAANVLFAFDSSVISASYFASLNETALRIKEASSQTDMVWQVVGYADLTGEPSYNQKLSEKRAQAVAAYLVKKGVNEAQLAIVSLGDSNSQSATEDDLHLQRRVEVHPYQAEIASLAEQLPKQFPKQFPKQLAKQQTKPDNTTMPQAENHPDNAFADSLPLQNEPVQSFSVSFFQSEQPLTTAMEF